MNPWLKYPEIYSRSHLTQDFNKIQDLQNQPLWKCVLPLSAPPHQWCPAHTGNTQNVFSLQGRGWASDKHFLNWHALFLETELMVQWFGLYNHLPESFMLPAGLTWLQAQDRKKHASKHWSIIMTLIITIIYWVLLCTVLVAQLSHSLRPHGL